MQAFFLQRTEPLPTPPPWVDLLLAAVFGLVGWWFWRLGGRWRSGALARWFLAFLLVGFWVSS